MSECIDIIESLPEALKNAWPIFETNLTSSLSIWFHPFMNKQKKIQRAWGY